MSYMFRLREDSYEDMINCQQTERETDSVRPPSVQQSWSPDRGTHPPASPLPPLWRRDFGDQTANGFRAFSKFKSSPFTISREPD
ncbi:hypothetical protein NQZ68_008633 [Dissostichus eleginoides]|nr:hypothetical protein NQZ68_008633 [Dissostichus eleginoides]